MSQECSINSPRIASQPAYSTNVSMASRDHGMKQSLKVDVCRWQQPRKALKDELEQDTRASF